MQPLWCPHQLNEKCSLRHRLLASFPRAQGLPSAAANPERTATARIASVPSSFVRVKRSFPLGRRSGHRIRLVGEVQRRPSTKQHSLLHTGCYNGARPQLWFIRRGAIVAISYMCRDSWFQLALIRLLAVRLKCLTPGRPQAKWSNDQSKNYDS